ncbi:ADP-ribosylglycohydrolase [Cnuella takakiae]|uniref:ADP-ribosylglycohydrolase n=1 Tax=Cnuella takakiae TaxID=1302690 RepID=A0A1M5GSP3_9BACT|nr:ADP-ribosylglycohydrolase family protein [Cnuella takakiae]OLY90906.1 hypothetical protein BUE76_02590 [Cnuella takakiae]SHG06638.1 ADP-ribosylglycohydrolase [Cnuella takakiae]
MNLQTAIRSALFGLAVGDALGVPVEFRSRASIAANPVVDMRGYGTHNQPPGTWSDDSSLTFCLAEALLNGYDLHRIADAFSQWYRDGLWTPHGQVFDIGIATADALYQYQQGCPPLLAGGADELSNGNGSLMRILPLLFYTHSKPIEERFAFTAQVSSITHRHIRSIVGCFYYLEFARGILYGRTAKDIYQQLQNDLPAFLLQQGVAIDEINQYHRLLQQDITLLPGAEIHSSGYVVHTLEASIWCLLTTRNYSEAVLKAVNLGEDTDTTGAICGGLAGLLYGFEQIPGAWLQVLARKKDIEALARSFAAVVFETYKVSKTL